MATFSTRVPQPEPGHEVLEATDARQGRWGRHVFWILIASTTLAVIALFAAWAFYSDAFTTVEEASTPTAAEAAATTGPVTRVRQQAWAGEAVRRLSASGPGGRTAPDRSPPSPFPAGRAW
jgi:hypothetical protein